MAAAWTEKKHRGTTAVVLCVLGEFTVFFILLELGFLRSTSSYHWKGSDKVRAGATGVKRPEGLSQEQPGRWGFRQTRDGVGKPGTGGSDKWGGGKKMGYCSDTGKERGGGRNNRQGAGQKNDGGGQSHGRGSEKQGRGVKKVGHCTDTGKDRGVKKHGGGSEK